VSRYLELCTLGDLLVRGREHHPERDALVLPGTRRSYRELTDQATQVARSLTALGVTRGDHVGLFLPNGPEFIEAMFGIFFTGAVAVLVNARFTARELGYVVRDAGLKVLLAGDAPGEPRTRADVITEALSPDQTMVVAAGTVLRPAGAMLSQEAFGLLADGVPADEIEARRQGVALRDPAIMFYTSGTTAMPRAACSATRPRSGPGSPPGSGSATPKGTGCSRPARCSTPRRLSRWWPRCTPAARSCRWPTSSRLRRSS
jgi:acyl-CoA synthetase (AMP-forming)/AMP-acid ligase II